MGVRDVVIDFAVLRGEPARLLVQQRAPDRKLFPGHWELPGGHLIPGESAEACIRRELWEECQMELVALLDLVHESRWADGTAHHIFAIDATGMPVPEPGKVICQQWIGPEQIGLLANGEPTPNALVIAAGRAFELHTRRGRS